jgi:hypothetical protein
MVSMMVAADNVCTWSVVDEVAYMNLIDNNICMRWIPSPISHHAALDKPTASPQKGHKRRCQTKQTVAVSHDRRTKK